ncbi:tRNA pseudouridine55 synthase [Entomoplasma freundtii]|uniref:tRNA pseudouridine synthase B n=1 Tax=Entomoplasma freundtii TaxID=74700 RepID=A0A2K8NSE3_9MOLU|nr:tRNA pseudouridine(55) synthase TruB [Entomoplasma freundtii]ATZ16476.1 tRNA pseudouridine synthase B [Entomoplasma freundtii]TDY56005.1 tRNA pseudouridine55 synthase [Entomoplasma freundtii]
MKHDGIFVVDKPVGLSTNAVIQTIKRNLKIKKVGHAGTLDPLASGVVICLVNEATKLSNFLLQADKSYLVTMKLFEGTDTYDAEGKTIQQDEPFFISEQEIKNVFQTFDGLTYNQTPPIYSAIKVNGKKLYDYARQEQEVEIKQRQVTIKSLKLVDITPMTITFETNVSKGTYIRSLVVDIAKALNTTAHVTSLRRLSSGPFNISEAVSLETINWSDLLDLTTALTQSGQSIKIAPNVTKVRQGQKIIMPNSQEDLVFLSDPAGRLLACYERSGNKGESDVFVCKRGLNLEE